MEVVQLYVPSKGKKLARNATLKRRRHIARKKIKKAEKRKYRLTRADALFAASIRERDGKCLFPGCTKTTNLTCSHYIGRATKSTRFDPDNCITLCTTHHFWDKTIGWEYQKQRKGEKGCDWDGRYTVFMRERLGEEGFTQLLSRAKETISQKQAIQTYIDSIEPVENT